VLGEASYHPTHQFGLTDAGQAVERGAQLDVGRAGQQRFNLVQLAVTADERVRTHRRRRCDNREAQSWCLRIENVPNDSRQLVELLLLLQVANRIDGARRLRGVESGEDVRRDRGA